MPVGFSEKKLGHVIGNLRISTIISYAVGNVADRKLAQGGPWNGSGMVMEHMEYSVLFMHG